MPFDVSRPIGPDNILWPSDMPVHLQHEAEWRLATAERSRLEREVIEAAKQLFASYADEGQRTKEHGEATNDLIMAVGALEKFESQHTDKR